MTWKDVVDGERFGTNFDEAKERVLKYTTYFFMLWCSDIYFVCRNTGELYKTFLYREDIQ